MGDLFTSGRIVDFILLGVVLECVALFLWRRRTGQGPEIARLIPNLAAGASLLLAVRFALVGASWLWVAACLLASLVAHIFDLRSRWRG